MQKMGNMKNVRASAEFSVRVPPRHKQRPTLNNPPIHLKQYNMSAKSLPADSSQFTGP